MEKYFTAGQATDDNMAHAHCMLDTYGYQYTHTGCVIHIAYPPPQWLHERASMLRYTSAACQFLVGTAVAQWLRCCATNQKVAGSIPDGVIGIFH